MVMGFFQFFTTGLMKSTRIGALNTVPSMMARIVPFGLFHISVRLYSVILCAFGVMVAHLTPTPYFLQALAASLVIWSLVLSLSMRPRS